MLWANAVRGLLQVRIILLLCENLAVLLRYCPNIVLNVVEKIVASGGIELGCFAKIEMKKNAFLWI